MIPSSSSKKYAHRLSPAPLQSSIRRSRPETAVSNRRKPNFRSAHRRRVTIIPAPAVSAGYLLHSLLAPLFVLLVGMARRGISENPIPNQAQGGKEEKEKKERDEPKMNARADAKAAADAKVKAAAKAKAEAVAKAAANAKVTAAADAAAKAKADARAAAKAAAVAKVKAAADTKKKGK